MTPKQYRDRFEALGFNVSQWCKFLRYDRSNMFRILKGEQGIPSWHKLVLDWLDIGWLRNPNDKTGD